MAQYQVRVNKSIFPENTDTAGYSKQIILKAASLLRKRGVTEIIFNPEDKLTFTYHADETLWPFFDFANGRWKTRYRKPLVIDERVE